jgi:hypothetical protein
MNSIREEIRKIVQEVFLKEDFRYRYDGEFEPTNEMVSNCQKALDYVSKNDLTTSNSNEGSGKSKAKSIVEKKPITHSQLKRMKAFFDKNQEEVKREVSRGKTLENSGLIQTWNLWGGDEGMEWCNKMISQRKSSNNTSKTVRGSSGIRTKNIMNPHNTRIHK